MTQHHPSSNVSSNAPSPVPLDDPQARLAEAKRRLHELTRPTGSSEAAPSPLLEPLRHPVGWAVGAVALGVGLHAMAKSPAGRTALRFAGRSALTAGRLLVLPAIAKSIASATGSSDDGGDPGRQLS